MYFSNIWIFILRSRISFKFLKHLLYYILLINKLTSSWPVDGGMTIVLAVNQLIIPIHQKQLE